MRNNRILLVEDDANDIELTTIALRDIQLDSGLEVARNGEEALHYLLRSGRFASRVPGDPAVILLDLKMPRMNGVEFLEQMRANPQLKMIPVVVLTSSREQSDLTRCYELGVNAYVVKPLRAEDFVDALKSLGMFWTLINENPEYSHPR